MSHFTTIKTQVRELSALAAAVMELGLSLERAPQGQKIKARGYEGNTIDADAVIRCKGPYDVALNRQADGSYALTCDWWQGHVAAVVGQNYGKLLQTYGVHVALKQARLKGWAAQRVAGKNGSVNVIISAP